MNRDVLQGKWKQIRGKVKEEWRRIADRDLDKIAGNTNILTNNPDITTLDEEIYQILLTKSHALCRRTTVRLGLKAIDKRHLRYYG